MLLPASLGAYPRKTRDSPFAQVLSESLPVQDWRGVQTLQEVHDFLKDNELLRKYANQNDAKTLFEKIESDLVVLCLKDQQTGGEELGNYLELVKEILAMLAAYTSASNFQSTKTVLNTIRTSTNVGVLRNCIEILGTALEIHNKTCSNSTSGSMVISEPLRKEATLTCSVMSFGFGVLADKPFSISDLVKKKGRYLEEYSKLYLTHGVSGFQKHIIDLADHLHSIRTDLPGFKSFIAKYLDDNCKGMKEQYRTMIEISIMWRAKFLVIATQPEVCLEDLMLLVLNAANFYKQKASKLSLDVVNLLKSLKLTQVWGSSMVSTILAMPNSPRLHAYVVKHFFEGTREAGQVLLSMLNEFNRDALRRRSSVSFLGSETSSEDKFSSETLKNSLLLKVTPRLIQETFLVCQKVMERYQSQEVMSNSERFKYGDLILSILDKSVIEKEQEGCLILNFTPECYLAGFQAISCDDSVLLQVFREGDAFLHKMLKYQKVKYLNANHELVEMTDKQKSQVVTEVAKTMVAQTNQEITDPASNLQNQLQQLLPDFLQMHLWKACFSPGAQAPNDLVVVAHKLLVAFFDEIASQLIVQAAEKLLTDGVFEGLFKFINESPTLELHFYAGTLFLVSRVIKSKKLEAYILETEILNVLFEKMFRRDTFLKSYIRRGKGVIGQQLTSTAEAVFEIANNSPKLAQELEKYITKAQQTFLSVQKAYSQLTSSYIINKRLASICDESSPLWKYWNYPSAGHEEFMNDIRLFEEFSQSFLRFFQMFIYTDSSNLATSLVEKGFAKLLIESFSTIGVPNWNHITERASIFTELFKHFMQNMAMPGAPQNSFLKKTGIPAFAEALNALSDSLSKVTDQELEMSIRFILKSTASVPIHPECLQEDSSVTMNQASFDVLRVLSNIVLISSVCTDYSLTTRISHNPVKTLLTEAEFLELFDILVKKVYPKLFKVQVPAYICAARSNLQKTEGEIPNPGKLLGGELMIVKIARSQNILDKLFKVFSGIMPLNFGANSKLHSEFYAKLGLLQVDPLAFDPSCPHVVRVAYILQYLDIIREFVSTPSYNSVPTVTGLCALYEGGLIPTADKTVKELTKMIGLGYCYLNTRIKESQPLLVDEVIMIEQLQVHVPTVLIDSCYSLHNKVIELGEDYHRLGVKMRQNEGMKKCRYIRLRLYESIRSVTTLMLENMADLQSRLAREVESSLVPEMATSGKSRVAEVSEQVAKSSSANQELLVQLLKVAGSPVTRDPFQENFDSYDPMDGELRYMAAGGFGRGAGMFGGPPPRNRDQRRVQVPAAVMTAMVDMGFTEERIQAAARSCRNPGDMMELTEWILAHPEPDEPQAEAANSLSEQPPNSMVDERPQAEECPGIELPQMKTEMTEGYKSLCQTLLRYFLYLPKKVDFGALLNSYSVQLQDQSSGVKASRKSTLAMHGVLIDFLILLKSQLVKLKPKQDIEALAFDLPSEFIRVKTVVYSYLDWRSRDYLDYLAQPLSPEPRITYSPSMPTPERCGADRPWSHLYPEASRGTDVDT